MANSDKNILITPSVGLSASPTIKFTGSGNTPTTLRVLDDGTISFEGTAGQLFSISDGLSGSIFSVNDISGIPSVEVLDTGLVKLNQYGGSTVFGASAALQSSSVNARVSIQSGSVASPALIVRAFTSSSANIQEWHRADGYLYAALNQYGSLYVSGNVQVSTLLAIGSGTRGTEKVFLLNDNAANVGLIIKGAASQTANLQEWQNSAGTVLASISTTGKLTSAVDASINGLKIGLGSASISSNLAFGANSLNSNTTGNNNIAIGGASLFSNTTGSSNTAIGSAALYGNTVGGGNMAIGFEALNQNIDGQYNTAIGSQSLRNSNTSTANYNVSIGLQSMYYNTSGGSNTAIGSVALLNNTSGNANIAIGFGALHSNTSGYNNTAIGANAGYLNVTGIQNIFIGSSAGYNETGSNKLYIANSNTATPLIGGDFSAKTLTFAGNATITSQATGTVGLIVKGAASQTGNLQEWQNSAGTANAFINQDGQIRGLNMGIGGTSVNIAYVRISNNASDTSSVALVIRGVNSQTGDLQQWQNSAGTVLAKVTSTGDATLGYAYLSGLRDVNGTGAYLNMQASTSGILVNTRAAANIGLIVKGSASQTANLQEWQNSAGTVLAKVDANGSFKGRLVYDINAQTGTTYSFALTDAASIVTLSSASAITASIPTDASVDFPIGSTITIIQTSSGQVTIQAVTAGTTTVSSNALTTNAPKLRGIGSSATLIKTSANNWYVIGDLY